jgi:hypothetical protein
LSGKCPVAICGVSGAEPRILLPEGLLVGIMCIPGVGQIYDQLRSNVQR